MFYRIVCNLQDLRDALVRMRTNGRVRATVADIGARMAWTWAFRRWGAGADGVRDEMARERCASLQ